MGDLTEIRLRQWDKVFPGSIEDVKEIFGTDSPSYKIVAAWRNSWYQTTPYQFAVTANDVNDHTMPETLRYEVSQTAKQAGIHPYFWDFYVDKKHIDLDKDLNGKSGYMRLAVPTVSFFKEEHHVMFKLTWR